MHAKRDLPLLSTAERSPLPFLHTVSRAAANAPHPLLPHAEHQTPQSHAALG